MISSQEEECTLLLSKFRQGDREAAEALIPLVYQDLRRLAHQYMLRERNNHTLQTTALVHEVYVRLFGNETIEWKNRAHFLVIAARQMRRILVDYAREAKATKRQGYYQRVSLDSLSTETPQPDVDLVALNEALARLSQLQPRASQVVELRFFGGLTEKEAAAVLGISVSTLKREWEFAKAWLFRRLNA